ncbi:RAD3-like DEAD/DEAH box helicase [Sphingomonas aurantiaca]|uniref:RAD3-like DEAD/DEAH box helicase n=1 Tax=Sphingomonas aurantiaca TaxID=185949 RepID=A0A2T5GJC8_9SPHN|nr:DEAD/DEAH box helicase [Sphingomonas aurantiaca]PTQ59433.1 RAD3-like DEAD/DEAH box helicase [Sphingomonas aurantiaca]
MPERDADRLALADEVRQSLGIENELTRPQARAYVRCLQTTWQVPTIAWGERESVQQLSDARRLLHAAHIFRSIEGPGSTRAIDCFRRTGEILEWLSRADDGIRRIVPIELLAAAAYQLGGLPAMATGLLAEIDSEHDGVQLYAAFLQANFDQVLRRAAQFWRANGDLTGRGAGRFLLDAMAGEDAERGVSWAFTVELIRSLGLVADCLRRGDDVRLETAMAKLHALDAMAARTFSDDAALVVGLLRQVADGFIAASIYKPLRALAALRPEREGKLLTYAREQFSRGRGILWVSQIHGLDRLLNETSFALCTPTGSGKTLVANMAIIKELLLRERDTALGPLALYIVPSRALAGEVEAKLSAELRGDVIVTGLYGGADWGITDYWLTSEEPVVLIVTVEKAEALLRYLGALLTARLALLIVDEAHQVVPEPTEVVRVSFSDHNNRSIRLETLVSRVLSQRPDVVRIALTAVAGGASGPVARWIEGRADAQAVGVRYRSTRQVIGVLEARPGAPGQILLDLMNGRRLYLRGEEDPVYLPLRFAPMPQLKAQWRNSLNRYNCLNVLWTALHLVEEDQRILISVAQEPEQTMRWFKEALELEAWQALVGFTPPTDDLLARYGEARAACLDYCGPDSFELFLLERGIATSHGQMPQRLRRLMIEMIDKKICAITVATATLTEGVNLPFDLIFLTSLKRRSWDAAKEEQIITRFSTSEFRNLAGRAGRPGAARGIEGMTLVALPRDISSTAAGDERTQRRQMREREQDYDILREQLLIEEQDADAVDGPLALLLDRIWTQANRLLGVQPDDFLEWLEKTAPGAVSEDAGTGSTDDRARLADVMDELDGVVLTALEEIARIEETEMTRPRAEEALKALWATTFTAVSAAREAWLEAAFIKRGVGVVETIYPDPAERRRLYHYGFTPLVGRRFDAVAAKIRAIIAGANGYGDLDATARIDVFESIGALLQGDRGFGFRVRPAAALLDTQARLTGTDGGRGRYSVIPIARGHETEWLDPAGFQLAVTVDPRLGRVNRFRSDFELRVGGGQASVERVFRPG